MSERFIHPQLSGRWRQTAGQPSAEAKRPVVISSEPLVSINQITTYHCSLRDEVAAIAEAGFHGIGLWRTKISAYDEEAVGSLLKEFGVRAASLSWAGGFTGSLRYSYAEALEDAHEAVSQAIRLEAETLVILTGSRNGHTAKHCRRTVKEAIIEVADEAGEWGVRLALMPIQARYQREQTFLTGVDDTLALLNEMDHPHVGLAFDTFQLWQTPRLMDRIPEIVPRTFVVQISDSPLDPRHDLDRRLPGRGELPLAEIVRQFLAYGYRGVFDVQVLSEDVWRLPLPEVISACREFVATAGGRATAYFT